MEPRWDIMFSTEVQDGCQWPYWKLPLRVILVVFASKANVIPLFHITQGHWIHFWDLHGWNVIFSTEIQDGYQWPHWTLPLGIILVLFVSEANITPLFQIIQGHWIHFWDLHGLNVIFATEIQDGCQWPYWKLPLRVTLVLFVSEANVIPQFHIIQGCWIHFWDLYCWNIIFAIKIQNGWQLPYCNLVLHVILVLCISETKLLN